MLRVTVVTVSPVLAAGFSALLGRQGCDVTVKEPWPSVESSPALLALSLPAFDIAAVLSPARSAFPGQRVVVWHEPHVEALAAGEWYDAWVTPAADAEMLMRALEDDPRVDNLAGLSATNWRPEAGDTSRPMEEPVAWAPWLTRREYELVCALTSFSRRRDLAVQLSISEDGIRYHLRHILEKTRLRSLRNLRTLTPREIVTKIAREHEVAERRRAREGW